MSIIGRIRGLFGGGSNSFQDTVVESIDRANVRFILPQDSALYLGKFTRTRINEKAEWLWQNFGIVKEGVAGIARHTVGKGVSLQIDSEDDDWNQLAEDDFEAYALTPERCDLSGRRNFYEGQTAILEQRVIRGEAFAAKTENPEWNNEPCFQLYDSQEICSPLSPVANLAVIDGVELNDASRAMRYWVRGLDGITHTPVPRERMIHWYKPHAINQTRGISDLAQAVNRLVDIHELTRLTTRTAKAQQLIALVLKGVGKKKTRGALGALSRAGKDTDGNPDKDTAQLEALVGAAGAGIAYMDAEGDAKMISPTSPTPLVEGFITDLLMRDVCAGWGVPAEFFWSIAKLGGANTRFVLSKADLLFQVLADGLIYRFCNPVAFRYLEHRMATGALRRPTDKDWALKLSWQTPPRVTVDNGRDNSVLIELLANGMITLREYCNARGQNYRHVMRQWIREPIEFIKMATQELKTSKLADDIQTKMLERWSLNMPLWRAAAPGAAANANGDAKTKASETNAAQTDSEEQAAA